MNHFRVATVAFSLAAAVTVGSDALPRQGKLAVRAKYLITVADDFVVDMYINGKLVPDGDRKMIDEKWGAMVERIDRTILSGDWVVFNVVNNRLRWNGVKYFGVAGCLDDGTFGFGSNATDGTWSECDDLDHVNEFISQKKYGIDRLVKGIETPWDSGNPLMLQHAGESWTGTPIWGGGRNTWIKVVVK